MPLNLEPEPPLAGLRIVLTRPTEQAGDFEQVVRALGGQPAIAPAIAILPPASWTAVDDELDRLGELEWIAFTSANAVRTIVNRVRARGISAASFAKVKIGVVGEATAAVLTDELRAPDLVAASASAQELGDQLPVTAGDRVLVPHGDRAGDALARVLRRRGANPTCVVAYRTVPGDGIPEIVERIRAGSVDALLFASGSAVRFVASALATAEDATIRRTDARRPAIFCIGPSTARAAASAGFAPDGIAAEATQRALVEEMIRWFAARRSRSA